MHDSRRTEYGIDGDKMFQSSDHPSPAVLVSVMHFARVP